VDKVIQSEREDCDVYLKGIVKYDRLFVGSDYKGTERFRRYEEIFADKGVEIVYFPYTTGTSSTQLRAYLSK
jgi:glycerol-3-phosphate cytidylyltransferase